MIGDGSMILTEGDGLRDTLIEQLVKPISPHNQQWPQLQYCLHTEFSQSGLRAEQYSFP